MSIERCPTGIKELDEVLEGGIPRGNIVLIAGNPGAGKTTFAAKFIYEGATKYNEKGVYLSFLESKRDFYKFMKVLGMDFEAIERRGLFKYVEGLQTSTFEGVEEVLDEFLTEVARFGAKRAVIDSVTAITQMGGFKLTRELIKNAIVGGLKPYEVTALLISELPLGSLSVGFGVEEFIVDGVIVLKSYIEGGHLVRKLEIRKMRGSSIPHSELPFEIETGVGLRVYPVPSLERVSAPSQKEAYFIPNPFIQKVLPGGIRRGSQIAVVTDYEVPVFKLAGCFFAYIAAKYGLPTLIISYSRGTKVIEGLLKHCEKFASKVAGFEINVAEIPIKIGAINPTSRPVQALLTYVRHIERKYNPKLEFHDSLDLLPAVYGSTKDFLREHLNNLILRRNLGITAIYTFRAPSIEKAEILPEIYDIVLFIKTIKEEVGCCYDIEVIKHDYAEVYGKIRVCIRNGEVEFMELTGPGKR